ncbi:HvfC family peptide modification chaperone [Mesoterricola silvestris]|uniref:DNA-binding domain-containing protein n=1 Tax=Mesoterricola silvestris TaxID=2927979 RepID=A0AA48H126_9BACT|nr:putative DNA-binding domain-containing protein [Mesoterricola silvestris]BDU74083.1 hypothetical protein METEAL_32570 [Mesoterricola silvestris]
MPESRTLRLQRSLAALVLDAEPPVSETFDGFREALLAYRDLARPSLVDPLESMFPVTLALLGEEGAWTPCVDAFLEARCVPSGHHRDIAPAFLGWLARTGWGRDRWPFLLELVHWELLETLVYRFEDAPAPGGLEPRPGLESRVVLDPATRLVSYAHAVHRATEAAPRPEPGPVHLLAHRDPEGLFEVLELTPATAHLLTEGASRPIGAVLGDLGIPDPAPALAFLANLRAAGALAGFAPREG